MTDTASNNPSLAQSIFKNATGLALFAMVTAGIIAVVQFNTKHTIEKNIAQAQARALHEITPKETVDNNLLLDTLDLTQDSVKGVMNINLLGKLKNGARAHFAKKDGQVHTIIFPAVSPNGYTTDIQLLVGITMNGSLAGVRVIDHKETPGLGDKIEVKKSTWIMDFMGKSLREPTKENWKVKKDGGQFDQFTGATITPRAVVGAVYQTLVFFNKNKDRLIAEFNLQQKNSLPANKPALESQP